MGWTAHQWQAWSFPALTLLAMLGGVILWDGGVAHLSACPAQQMAFLAVNGGSTILPAWFWYGLTGLGDAAVLMPALALLTLRKPQAWAAVVASVPTAALMSVLGKHWSAVARPAAVLDASSFTLIEEALRYNSFPSGHSITVFAAAAAVLATLLPSPRTSRARLLLAAGVTVALMIALSRVAVGAHWLADVLAGGAGGWLAGLSGAALARRTGWWRWLLVGKGRQAAGAFLCVWGLLLLLQAHRANGNAAILALSGLCGLVAGFALLIRRPNQAAAGTCRGTSLQRPSD